MTDDLQLVNEYLKHIICLDNVDSGQYIEVNEVVEGIADAIENDHQKYLLGRLLTKTMMLMRLKLLLVKQGI